MRHLEGLYSDETFNEVMNKGFLKRLVVITSLSVLILRKLENCLVYSHSKDNQLQSSQRDTMNLIQITQTQINGADVNSVNAKELHQALGLRSKFANWIKKQKEILDTYEEGKDYIRTTKDASDLEVIVKSGLSLKGKECEYILTLDMAKHICMMSKTEKGKEVRQYFIDTEKKATSLMTPTQIMESLQLTAQTFKIHDEILDTHHKRIKEVETYIKEDLENRPVNYSQQKALTDIKNQKVYQYAESDKQTATMLHRKVWHLFKKRFNLPRYSELPASKFNEGAEYIRNLTLADLLA